MEKKSMSNLYSNFPVLVLGEYLCALWIARDFGHRGIDVYVVATRKNDISLQSKYFKKRITAPGPWTCLDLKTILKKAAKTTTKRLVVYSIADVDTLNLSKIKDELKDDYYFVVGDKEATEILINKNKFYRALEKNGILYPKTFFPEDLVNVKRISKDLRYPVFIRPSITQQFRNVFGARKGFIANNSGELLQYYCLATSKNVEVMLQEIIFGPADNSFQLEAYFDKTYCPTGFFARQRLRIWPPDFGNTTLCVSIPLSKLSLEKKKMCSFLKNIKYNGLASAEFKKDPKDGQLKLLEINARPWIHFWFSKKCGIDILFSSYLDAIGEKATLDQKFAIGIKSIHLQEDLQSSMHLIRKGELTIPKWVLSIKEVRQSALFDKKDLLPFFVSWLEKLHYVFSYYTSFPKRTATSKQI